MKLIEIKVISNRDNSLWDRKIDFKTDMLSNDGCEPAVKSTNSVDKPSCILPPCP
ncbi:hypothetical protein T11_4102 [Trichinella zimbabwensis]|uniref:Uncharacterized protein n=1 Tax=Trichinella zimbabwensis TaxID=268475 RepID=A0A0V1GI55_9BILA|nr:hypothetical protein T11_4102 [Trichinella zimbabwensis]